MPLINKEAHPKVSKGSEVLVVKRFKKYYIYIYVSIMGGGI